MGFFELFLIKFQPRLFQILFFKSFNFQLFTCVFTISLSFQNIGGLVLDITWSRFYFLYIFYNFINLFDLLNKVLRIKQSSFE